MKRNVVEVDQNPTLGIPNKGMQVKSPSGRLVKPMTANAILPSNTSKAKKITAYQTIASPTKIFTSANNTADKSDSYSRGDDDDSRESPREPIRKPKLTMSNKRHTLYLPGENVND